ncbi:hypothetical protein T439DRAFT_326112 [Meredithblackwellia eburnea MCA 4105]
MHRMLVFSGDDEPKPSSSAGDGYQQVPDEYGQLYPVPQSQPRPRRRVLVVAALAAASAVLLWLRRPERSLNVIDTSENGQSCSPMDYSRGTWVLKDPPLHANTSHVTVFEASNFVGCRYDYKPYWNFGTHFSLETAARDEKELEMTEYRWNGSQWRWKPEKESCKQVDALKPETLVRDLVQNGGWLLLGDSVTHQHFFSLSCFLYEHVRYQRQRGKGQLFLRPDTHLYNSSTLPSTFNFQQPLVSFIRTDHGFDRGELEELYDRLTPKAERVKGAVAKHKLESASFTFQLETFLDPAANYQALIFSTGAHFSALHFHTEGLGNTLVFFKRLVGEWVDRMAEALRTDGSTTKRVLVRAATSGHDDCHNHTMPYKKLHDWDQKLYNWGWMGRFNEAFRDAVVDANNSQINFISIDDPQRLRPDGHTNDCMHVGVGLGIIEGWSNYVYYHLNSTRSLLL